jgi:hypothetical protein
MYLGTVRLQCTVPISQGSDHDPTWTSAAFCGGNFGQLQELGFWKHI